MTHRTLHLLCSTEFDAKLTEGNRSLDPIKMMEKEWVRDE